MISFKKHLVYVYERHAEYYDVLDNNIISKLQLDKAFVCMFSDEVTIITIVGDGTDSEVRILMFKDASDYSATLEVLRSSAPSLRFSKQNSKLIDYSRQVSAKLRDGIDITVVDAQSDDNIVECPSCGMKNEWNPAMPYCLDCGELLHR